MIQYRALTHKKEEMNVAQKQKNDEMKKEDRKNAEQLFVEEIVSTNDTVAMNWIRAMQKKAKNNELSSTRQHYMETLLGSDWIQAIPN